jgi:hypothetical protein
MPSALVSIIEKIHPGIESIDSVARAIRSPPASVLAGPNAHQVMRKKPSQFRVTLEFLEGDASWFFHNGHVWFLSRSSVSSLAPHFSQIGAVEEWKASAFGESITRLMASVMFETSSSSVTST